MIPADICLCILDNLSQPDMNALARTNRQFYHQINPRLYHYNVRHHNASALWWAVEHQHRVTADYSLDQGADINARNENGDTLLTRTIYLRVHAEYYTPRDQNFAALITKLDSLVTLFLDRGIDINARGFREQTAFHKACGGLDETPVRTLIARGADIDMTDASQMSGLHIAAGWTLNRALVGLLIEQGLDLEAKDAIGRTPLHVATEVGNIENMEILLENGAHVDCRGNGDFTPLMEAVCRFKLGPQVQFWMIEMLLEHGADIRAVDHFEEQTVLHLAVEYRLPALIVQYLVDWGADLDARDVNYLTAREQAYLEGCRELLPILTDFVEDEDEKAADDDE